VPDPECSPAAKFQYPALMDDWRFLKTGYANTQPSLKAQVKNQQNFVG
jgi:hypothetical protein